MEFQRPRAMMATPIHARPVRYALSRTHMSTPMVAGVDGVVGVAAVRVRGACVGAGVGGVCPVPAGGVVVDAVADGVH